MHVKIIVLFALILLSPLSEMYLRDYASAKSSNNEYSKFYKKSFKKGYMTEEEMKILKTLPKSSEEQLDDIFDTIYLVKIFLFFFYISVCFFLMRRGEKIYAAILIFGYLSTLFLV